MIDLVKLTITAGKGGDGCKSFRRERRLPKGGPDGGDGGNGGSVYIIGDSSLNTLLHLRYHSLHIADSGQHGGSNNKQGARGRDLVIKVPLGTTVYVDGDDAGRFLGDVLDTKPLLVCRGGKGGKGNTRFATSVNQIPLLAEAGERGETVNLTLELKLLADVGIVGMPNAGKSTLISACSAAKPKIAEYPFTTVDPVLGIVEYGHKDFLLMEVPGLIEGAHLGVGLGDRFLRHAERARVLWHLVDGAEADLVGRVKKVNHELNMFKSDLSKKLQILVVNKMDMLEARENVESSTEEIERQGIPIYYVAAASRYGLDALIAHTLEVLEFIPKPEPQEHQPRVPELLPMRKDGKPQVRREGETFVIDSPQVDRLVAQANMRDGRVRLQLWRQLENMGIAGALEKEGVQAGDTVRLGKVEMEWE